MAINHNNGNDGDFDDDIFDGEDFNDQDFDSENFDENDFSGDADMDGDLPDEEFDDGDWADHEGASPAAKEKSLYQSREKKGLSFNTIIIIGAVVVGGGVMMTTVMNKSAEVSAGSQNVFRSMLSMVGVMDGELSAPTETIEEGQQQEAVQETGFLSDPSLVENQSAEQQNPPQPVPMAPEEAGAAINEPLTPLPEDLYAGTPRGPEEALPNENDPVPAETTAQPVLTAEDILKQAQANREKKLQNEAVAEQTPAEPALPVAEKPSVDIAAPNPEPVVTPTPAQVPVVTPVSAPSISSEALAENTKALEGVTNSLDTMIKRMERMEGDITAVRQANESQYQEIEKTIASLKNEVSEIKARPAAKAAVVEKAPSVAPVETTETESSAVAEKTAAPAKKHSTTKPAKTNKPVTVAKTQPQADSSGAWQLRAAQPGRAWVSRAGQRDMQGIEVGQTLPGVGRITAITYQNGRWAVVGSQGTIQQ